MDAGFRQINEFAKDCKGTTSVRPDSVFDGQTNTAGLADSFAGCHSSRDLSELFAAVSLDDFVIILSAKNFSHSERSECHYWDINGFLMMITRYNKIMQIFTAQTSKWHSFVKLLS